MKEKPEITEIRYEGKKVGWMHSRKLVRPFGTSSHITLPKELIGENVFVIYIAGKAKDIPNIIERLIKESNGK